MKTAIKKEGNVTVLLVDGDIDCFTVPDLREVVKKQLQDDPGNMVVDLSDVTYVDSSAIGYLVNTQKSMKEMGYSLGLVHVNKETMQLLRLTYIDNIMKIYSSYEEFKNN